MHPYRLSKRAVILTALILYVIVPLTHTQENAQLQVPPSLEECYNTTYYMNRDNRLPSTINSLIDLIRKVENSPNFNMDIRTLAVSLLHRFRQDGIQRAAGVQATPGVLPYSPTGFQFPKFRILLSRLIQGDARTFPNSSLTQEERCSMHFMLSSSYNLRVRGDEGTVCNQLSQYRSNRVPRSLRQYPYNTNFLADVEVFDIQKKSKQGSADTLKANPFQDFDYYNPDAPGYGNQDQVSQCPVENGVIWTPWGTVAAGSLLAGIAAGLQQQTIQLRTLLALSRRPGQVGSRQSSLSIDNRWASTVAGDLAEVALVQVPVSSQNTATVGAGGTWNDTVMAKWYFLSQRLNLELTDAEIRGDMDGFIIAMNIAQWRNQASPMKLSQLLSMYYSLDGVLNTGIMACNRQSQFANVALPNDMIAQTTAFAQVLDTEMQLRVTLQAPAIQQFSQAAANELNDYIPQYLNDISCQASNPQTGNTIENITSMTDIYVFLDVSWQYNTIVDVLAYVLERINVAPYASSVTLLCAGDGQVIANKTNYMSDIYQQWNVTTQSNYSPGFNFPLILKTIQNLTQTYMDGQQRNSSVGGRSMIALLVPNTATVNDADSNYVQIQLQYIREDIPDLRFIFYTGGSPIRFNSFVVDPSQDLFAINLGQNNVASQGRPVVQRIRQLQRRIINPRCGSSWTTSTWGQDQMYQYISPNYINFYRLAPNYFYRPGNDRSVSIGGTTGASLIVCTSRSTQYPMQNATTFSGQTDVTCQQLSGSGNSVKYDLANACSGYYTIHQCPPLYISVQASSTYAGSNLASCRDPACQYPNQIRYQVTVQNLGCFNGVGRLVISLSMILFASFVAQNLS